MSTTTTRPLRRERRAAELAARRDAARRQTAGRSSGRSAFTLPRITIGAIVAGLVVVAALTLVNQPRSATPTTDLVRAAAPAGIPSRGAVLGAAGAPVSIELYEDFQCPACRRWGENVFPALVGSELRAGTVTITYHAFAFIGPESLQAARAAWAAEQQGHFWDYWATLYANQGLRENGGAFTRERLLAMADLVGLDRSRFVADLDSPAAATALSDANAAAAAAGISSTPTVIVDGQIVTGGYTELAAAIAAAAAR